MTDYPEHEKMAGLRPKIDIVTDFLEWCESTARHVVTIDDEESFDHVVVGRMFGIRELLAAYFQIDEDKIENEKRAMLALIRGEAS